MTNSHCHQTSYPIHPTQPTTTSPHQIQNTTLKQTTEEDALPYSTNAELVPATKSIDAWSFGCLLFTLLSEQSLFNVNQNDDLVKGDNFEKLYEWNEVTTGIKLTMIGDLIA